MSINTKKGLSLEEKRKAIQEAATEMNKLMSEEYHRIKIILEKSETSSEADFTLTVGIQNAYLG